MRHLFSMEVRRNKYPDGMTFFIRKLPSGKWELKGTGIPYPQIKDSKNEAIFAAEFDAMHCKNVTIHVDDPDEETYAEPEYWHGDLIDCP